MQAQLAGARMLVGGNKGRADLAAPERTDGLGGDEGNAQTVPEKNRAGA
jgi:hypothetical protein